MELYIDSSFDIVISQGLVDNFTAREISIGLCCLIKSEHYDLTDIQKRASEYLEKLTDNGLLESISENNQPNVYKKTNEFHKRVESLESADILKALFIRDCQLRRAICDCQMSEYRSVMRLHTKYFSDTDDFQEVCTLLEERYNSINDEIEIIEQLLSIYYNERSSVLE